MNEYNTLLLSFVLIYGASIAQDNWTQDDVDDLKLVIRNYFAEDLERVPGALRLAFHDCVGGCDGCINMGNTANWGLETDLSGASQLYDDNMPFNSKTMSHADFFNLLGIVAVEFSTVYNNDNCLSQPDCQTPMADIVFSMGRMDCPTSPSTNDMHDFPAPYWNHSELMDYWDSEFGLTQAETVALLGAHTLGKMTNGSGYHGRWKPDHYAFNNDFYKFLVDNSYRWIHFDNAEGDIPTKDVQKDADERWQWQGRDENEVIMSYMLDIDMDLAYDLNIIDEGGESTCSIGEETPCPQSPSYSITETYAQNATAWIGQFVCAYHKLGAKQPDSKIKMALPPLLPVARGPQRKGTPRIGCEPLH